MTKGVPTKRSHWPVTVLTGLASLFNLFLPIILVRLFSAHDVGVYKLFFLYAAVVPAFSLVPGVVSGLAYWSGRGDEGRAAVSTSGWTILFISGVACALGTIFLSQLSSYLGWSPEITFLFVIYTSSYLATMFFEEAAISSGRSWIGAGFFSIFELVKMIVVLCAAILFQTLEAVLLAYSAVYVTKFLTGYIGALWLGLISTSFHVHHLRSVVAYALPVGLAWVFGVFVEKSDQLVLSALIPPEEFALYALGCLAVPPLFALEQSVTRVLIPQLSRAFHDRNNREAASLYALAVEQLALVLLPAAMGMAIFAEPIVELLFGSAYGRAALYMQVFSLSYVALIVPGDTVARAVGASGWILRSFILFSIISVLFSSLGAWLGGALGALIGFILGRFIIRGISLSKSLYLGDWQLASCIPKANLSRLMLLVIGLATCSLLVRPFFYSDIVWFLAVGPLFTITYFVLAFFIIQLPVSELSSSHRMAMLVMNLQLGGLERMTVTLAKGLKECTKWEPLVICYEPALGPDDPGLLSRLKDSSIPLETLNKGPGFSLKAGFRIARILRAHQIHVVHAHNLSAAMYAIVAKFFLGGRLRIVYTQHTLVHLKARERYKWFEWLVSRMVNRIVVISPEIRAFYSELGVGQKKIVEIANGVEAPKRLERDKLQIREELSMHHQSLSCVTDRFWLLALSRLDAIKGQRYLAQLWAELPSEIKATWALIIVGPETTAGEVELISQLAQAELGRSMVVIGEGVDPNVWMAAAEAFISLSTFEGMPLAPLEALAADLPVILSDIPGHRFLAEMAAFIPLDNVVEAKTLLAARLLALCAPAETVQEQGQRNRWVTERYGIEAFCAAYDRVYRGL